MYGTGNAATLAYVENLKKEMDLENRETEVLERYQRRLMPKNAMDLLKFLGSKWFGDRYHKDVAVSQVLAQKQHKAGELEKAVTEPQLSLF